MNLFRITPTKLTVAIIVVLVILLWVPFGLKSTVGLFEEWPARAQFQRGHWKFNSAFFFTASRPLALLPFAFAAELAPNSFVGFNLVMIGSFIGKGIIVYLLLKRLVPENQILPPLTAILFILFPTDEGLMSLRGVGIHLLVFIFLLLVYAFVLYWQHPEKIFLWLVIWPLQFLIVGSYEPLFPLIFTIPLLLIWLEKRITRQIMIISVLWLVVPCISIFWVLTLILGNHTDYVNSQIESSQQGTDSAPHLIATSMIRMYRYHVEIWGDIFQQIDFQSSFTYIAMFAGTLGGLLLWQIFRKPSELDQSEEKPTFSSWEMARNGLLLLAGLAIMLLGFLPYTLTPFRDDNFRVFYVAALGAGLTLAVLIWMISQIKYVGRALAVALSSIFITLAMLSNLNQHQTMADASTSVQRLLGSIVMKAPSVERGAAIIIVDEAQLYQDDWHLAASTQTFRPALVYIYGWRIKAYFCTVFIRRAAKYCEFKSNEIIHAGDDGKEGAIPYETAVIFRTRWNGEIELLEEIPTEYLTETLTATYDPYAHIDSEAKPPERALTVFSCWPLTECIPSLTTASPQSEIRLEFDGPVRGLGWDLAGPNIEHLWTTHKVATIQLNLASEGDLAIEFDINYVLDNAILRSLALEVNGTVIPLQYEVQDTGVWYHGTIPQTALQGDFDESILRFSVHRIVSPLEVGLDDDGTRPVGLLFDWLHIYPVTERDTS